jgi:hypothetical protein
MAATLSRALYSYGAALALAVFFGLLLKATWVDDPEEAHGISRTVENVVGALAYPGVFLLEVADRFLPLPQTARFDILFVGTAAVAVWGTLFFGAARALAAYRARHVAS